MKLQKMITIGAMALITAAGIASAQTSSTTPSKKAEAKKIVEAKHAANRVRQAEVKKKVETTHLENKARQAEVKKKVATRQAANKARHATIRKAAEAKKADNTEATTTPTVAQ